MRFTSGGLIGGQYRPLSAEQIETIHDAALHILETTGLTYEPNLEDVIDELEQKGVQVDRSDRRLRFSRDWINSKITQAPEQFTLFSRDGRNDLEVGHDRVYLGNGGAAIRVFDTESEEARVPVLKDIYNIGRIMDRLDNIHFCLRPCMPTDVPDPYADTNFFYAFLKSVGKHMMGGINHVRSPEDIARVTTEILELFSMATGRTVEALRQRPLFSTISCFCISPLKLSTTPMRTMLEAVKNDIPVALSGAPMAGSTAPITIAAMLAMLHAEQMAGISICQVYKPGSRVLYGGAPALANMKTLGYRGGAVECGMANAAVHQLARHISVPNYNSAGLSDSKLPDAQAGHEKGMNILLAAMGGSNYIHHAAGMLDSMLAVSYEQYVLDDEIIGKACKVLKGIETDAEHLALEIIDAVGPGGNYITSPHTMRHMRAEYYLGNGIADDKDYARWKADGGKDARARAREMVNAILSEDAPTIYLPDDVDADIRQRFKIFL